MPRELVTASLQEAERSEPAVKAAALLHIARVLNVFDHVEAERVMERALAIATALSEPDRDVILAQAVSFVATVSPKRAVQLAPSVSHDMPGGVIQKALFDMGPQIFNRWFGLLPPDEAAAVVRDLVRGILGQPDESIHASTQDVRFSSTHAHRLFQILGPLQRLEPQLAESLIKEHPQLGAAAARYPYGQESIEAALRQRDAQAPAKTPTEQPHHILVGHRLIPINEAVSTDFKEAFEVALRAYAADTDPERPNDAPRECWPSAGEFRNILHHAGQHEGPGAVRHLDRIPDAALRLFAQIELAPRLQDCRRSGA